MSEQIICPANGSPCGDSRILGNGTGALCRSYGFHPKCLVSKLQYKPASIPAEKAECEMSFEKCYECELVDRIEPFIIGVNQSSPYRLVCKATGKEIEITKCIKEA